MQRNILSEPTIIFVRNLTQTDFVQLIFRIEQGDYRSVTFFDDCNFTLANIDRLTIAMLLKNPLKELALQGKFLKFYGYTESKSIDRNKRLQEFFNVACSKLVRFDLSKLQEPYNNWTQESLLQFIWKGLKYGSTHSDAPNLEELHLPPNIFGSNYNEIKALLLNQQPPKSKSDQNIVAFAKDLRSHRSLRKITVEGFESFSNLESISNLKSISNLLTSQLQHRYSNSTLSIQNLLNKESRSADVPLLKKRRVMMEEQDADKKSDVMQSDWEITEVISSGSIPNQLAPQQTTYTTAQGRFGLSAITNKNSPSMEMNNNNNNQSMETKKYEPK